jgi:hypothetical protein
MKKSHLLGTVCACICSLMSVSSYASLLARDLDGNLTTAEAYYDTVLGITWLANANSFRPIILDCGHELGCESGY